MLGSSGGNFKLGDSKPKVCKNKILKNIFKPSLRKHHLCRICFGFLTTRRAAAIT